jgi:uncharacterized Tic20 family protein
MMDLLIALAFNLLLMLAMAVGGWVVAWFATRKDTELVGAAPKAIAGFMAGAVAVSVLGMILKDCMRAKGVL